MLVFDLDGTIVRSQKISTFCIEVIEKCKRMGYCIAIATARPHYSAACFTELIQPNVIIASGGAWISINSNVFSEEFLTNEDCNYIYGQLKDLNIHHQLIFEEQSKYISNIEYCKRWEGYQDAIIFSNYNIISETIYKIILPCNKDSLVILGSSLSKIYKIEKYNNSKWLRITNKKATKEHALDIVLSFLGTSSSDVISFGDDDDDIGLLNRCGLGVAVRNATDNLKQNADIICDSVKMDGVPKWITLNVFKDGNNLKLQNEAYYE